MAQGQGMSAQDWVALINRPSLEAFSLAFSKDATLDASVLREPMVGAPDIRRFFDATRTMYESIAFVHETTSTLHTYLSWEGLFAGKKVAGVTVLHRDELGVIKHIALYHRPFDQVLAFSAELIKLLNRST